jgi:hypothetical protein
MGLRLPPGVKEAFTQVSDKDLTKRLDALFSRYRPARADPRLSSVLMSRHAAFYGHRSPGRSVSCRSTRQPQLRPSPAR